MVKERFEEEKNPNKQGNPWWVAKEVCEILELKGDAGQVTRHLDPDEKTTLMIKQDGSNYKSKHIIINEPGLYSLILRSRKPEAVAFKRWITHEVIPEIRQTEDYDLNGIAKNLAITLNSCHGCCS